MLDTSRSQHADICIIGAGSSGVAVAKALQQKGGAFDCFEKGSDLGGMWRYENDSGTSCAYRSLHIDTSRNNLGYPDFPISTDKPDFLSHREMLAYPESYADHFGVRSSIQFKNEGTAVEKSEGGRWRVTAGCRRGLGLTVNPDIVRAQIEGGTIFGLSAAMYSEITLAGGAVDQSSFDTYRVMRINEAPKIEVHQIRNRGQSGGVGEAGTAAAAPALGNAIFAATGNRLRKLPFANGQFNTVRPG
jgi:hypothetical protein